MKVTIRTLISLILLLLAQRSFATPELEKFLADPRFRRIQVETSFGGKYTLGRTDKAFYVKSSAMPEFFVGVNNQTAWAIHGSRVTAFHTNEFGGNAGKAYSNPVGGTLVIASNVLNNVSTLLMSVAKAGSITIDGDEFEAMSIQGKVFSGTVIRDGARIAGFSYIHDGYSNRVSYSYGTNGLPESSELSFVGLSPDKESHKMKFSVLEYDLSPVTNPDDFLPSRLVPSGAIQSVVIITNGATFSLDEKGKMRFFRTVELKKPNVWPYVFAIAPPVFLAGLWLSLRKKERTT